MDEEHFLLSPIRLSENMKQISRHFWNKAVLKFCMNFYKGDTGQTEMLRRLLVAELMGEFKDLKYHDADLEKELAFPISEKQMKLWAENLQLQRKEWKIWEEDRFSSGDADWGAAG